jgi:hypothetical protein
MGPLEWVGLGYAALLAGAVLIAASLCRIARLSARATEHRREVLIWGSSIPRDTAHDKNRILTHRSSKLS